MIINKAIKEVMKRKGITQSKMAEILGLELGQRVVSNKLSSKNMTTEMILMFLDAMDYELVIKPKTRGKRKEDEILIESIGDE
ncbi:hypothetical protein [Methanobrevibacter sp.]|uniref:hypothetical protein n=1 Tax=Methanobrevibacter sp. TaxID=66852 RepID=UPI00388D381B